MIASPKHPMSSEQLDAVDMMKGTTFPVSSWDKRFFRHILESRETGQIGEKAIPQLWRIFIKYRRQHRTEFPTRRSELLRLAETLSAPDLRKVAAAQSEQNRIDELKAEKPRLLGILGLKA